jgi:hypothetical protein
MPTCTFLRLFAGDDGVTRVDAGFSQLLATVDFAPPASPMFATRLSIYLGRTPSHLSAIPPPRGRPGQGSMDSPFRVEYLDAERLLSVLVRKAA